jgi:YVTN family beta-propeller protein
MIGANRPVAQQGIDAVGRAVRGLRNYTDPQFDGGGTTQAASSSPRLTRARGESMLTRLFALAGAVALTAALCASAAAQPTPSYKLARSVLLGAPNRWDYLTFDAPSHRLYVAHGEVVSVLDARDGKIIGRVAGTPGGSHGIVITPDGAKGYTDDGMAGAAVVFDPASLKVMKRIPTAPDADGIAFDHASGHVFVIDGDSAKVSVIDPKTDKVIATIDGGGKLEFAVADDAGHLYVNGQARHEIVAIDTRTNKVEAHWPMSDCVSPHGLAIDRKARRLFSTCANSLLTVVNADTGKVVATTPIGRGSDGAAFDPHRKLVFSPNGVDGTLSVIRQVTADRYVLAATIPTAVSGRTMAIDPATGRLYIAAADAEPSPTPGGRPRPRPDTLRVIFLDPHE